MLTKVRTRQKISRHLKLVGINHSSLSSIGSLPTPRPFIPAHRIRQPRNQPAFRQITWQPLSYPRKAASYRTRHCAAIRPLMASAWTLVKRRPTWQIRTKMWHLCARTSTKHGFSHAMTSCVLRLPRFRPCLLTSMVGSLMIRMRISGWTRSATRSSARATLFPQTSSKSSLLIISDLIDILTLQLK